MPEKTPEVKDAVVNKTIPPPKKDKTDKISKLELKTVPAKQVSLGSSNSTTSSPKNENIVNSTTVNKKSVNKNNLNTSKGTESTPSTRKVRFFLHLKNS